MMNDTLKDEIEEGFYIVYIDDILIFAKNKEDLEWFTKCVLESLQKQTSMSNWQGANSARWKSNILALLLKKVK